MSSYQDYLAALRHKATEIRINALKMISAAGSGSTGSAMSCVEILTALYYGQMHNGPILNIDPGRPGGEGQDFVVVSKLGGVPVWYSILADLGYFSTEELQYFKQAGALLTTNPRPKIPGVPLVSGSPGQGIAGAVGLALSLKADRERHKVFVLAGDAEMGVGMTWEALIQAGQAKLGNFVLIVDRNGIQYDGLVRNLNVVEPIADKLEHFGFRTFNVLSGHDFDQLIATYEKAVLESRLPVAIVVKTVKGKGVDFAENKGFYHDKPLSAEELEEALAGLNKKIE